MLEASLQSVPLTIIATGALVGIAATLVGTFLVLRGSSMLTDAISHSIVFGIVVVWLITRAQSGPVQILGAALTGVLTVFLTELLTSTRRVKNDAAIGLVFPVLFSIGVLLLNLYARDVHIDQHTVLLGEIGFVWLDTVTIGGLEVPRSLMAMAAVTVAQPAVRHPVLQGAQARDLRPGAGQGARLHADAAVLRPAGADQHDGGRGVRRGRGRACFIAFAIVPPAAAYLLTDRLWLMMVYGSAVSVASSIGGYLVAVAWDVSIGGMMAVMTGVFLAAAFLFRPTLRPDRAGPSPPRAAGRQRCEGRSRSISTTTKTRPGRRRRTWSGRSAPISCGTTPRPAPCSRAAWTGASSCAAATAFG